MATATLRDVARAAGVSTASASRALARPDTVSDELRGRILAAARRLGYEPNLAARALVARRSGLIAMLVDTLNEPLPAAVAAALESALRRAGYALIIATLPDGADEALARAREMLGRGVEALVSWDLPATAGLAECVAAHAVPWLGFGESGQKAPAFAAGSGRRGGAMLGCRYLLSLGHQRFGVIAAPAAGIREAAREVLRGTDATLLETEPAGSAGDPDGVRGAVCALLDREATAFICGNEVLAMAVLRECRTRGISVPGEVSVVGFGDSLLARCSAPALTSVRVSAEEIGARTAEALLLMLRGGTPAAFEPALKLVIRDSTGPFPG